MPIRGVIAQIVSAANPSAAPAFSNQIYTNSATGAIYISNGTTSVANWIQVNDILNNQVFN
jgi:hypothetical protein